MPPQCVNAMPKQVPDDSLTGCSKEPSSKAAGGESKPEAYFFFFFFSQPSSWGYVEDFHDEPRRSWRGYFSIMPHAPPQTIRVTIDRMLLKNPVRLSSTT